MKFSVKTLLLSCAFVCANGWAQAQDCERLLDTLGKIVNEGRFAEMEGVLIQADSICRREVKEQDSLYASLLDTWGVFYVSKGSYQQALPFFEKAIPINLQSRGFFHEQTGATYNNASLAYNGIGDWANALAFIDTSLLIGEKIPGPSSLVYGERRMNRGFTYLNMGRLAEAVPDLEFALKNAKENEVPRYSYTLFTRLSALGVLYTYLGEFQKALPPSIEIVEIADSLYGREDPNAILARNNLSQLYYYMGDLSNAEILARLVLDLVKPENNMINRLRSNLGVICLQKGQYKEAMAHLQHVIETEKTYPTLDPVTYAMVLDNLANVHFAIGNYDRAVSLFMEALEMVQQNLGKQNRAYPIIATSLASCQYHLGNLKLAAELGKEAFDIIKSYGEQYPAYETLLANALLPLESSPEVVQHIQEIAEIVKRKYGENSMQYGDVLGNYGANLGNLGMRKEALPILKEAEKNLKKSAGILHKDYLEVLRNLATNYEWLGRYRKSNDLWKQCLALTERSIGRENSFYAFVVTANADLEQYRGKTKQAFAHFQLADSLYRRLSERNFAMLSDNGREHFQENEVRPQMNTWHSFAWRNIGDFPEISGLLYDDMLWEKGYLLHSALSVLSSLHAEPGLKGAMQAWLNDKERLAKLYENNQKTELDRQEIDRLVHNLELNEALLTQRSATFRAARQLVVWQDVQTRLAPDEAAIEFFHFRYSQPASHIIDSTYYYAAVVLRPGVQLPVFVPLFEEKQLDTILNTGFSNTEEVFNAIYNNELYQLIWAPLVQQLYGVQRVWYSPGGKLHQIAFAALPVSDTLRLAQTMDLRQVGSTRELVVSPEPLLATGLRNSLFLGCVAYPTDSTLMELRDPGCDSSLCDIGHDLFENRGSSEHLRHLPCTGGEVEECALLFRRAGVKAEVRLGYETLEDDLKKAASDSVPSPDVVHFAGHGYTDTLPASLWGRFPTNNPMFSSMLLMAGAQNAWAKGESIPGFDDGLLTAREIGELNLTNTGLVVLSGCQTALGAALGSEGVYGLQRGIKLAGAKAVLATLWRIPDNGDTRQFLRLFYSHWLAGIPAREALHTTQLEAIKLGMNPVAWAAWVMI